MWVKTISDSTCSRNGYHYRKVAVLTPWGRATHICVGKLTTISSDNGLSPGRRQVIIWNYCWNIVKWNLEWNFNRNSNIFIQENAFQNVVWEMASILSRPQCVKPLAVYVSSGPTYILLTGMLHICHSISSSHNASHYSHISGVYTCCFVSNSIHVLRIFR